MFWKTKNKYISGSTVWGFIQFVFIVCPGQGVAKYIEHKCWPLAYTANKAILKSKNDLELLSQYHFLHGFWRKMFLTIFYINWQHFIVWLFLLLEISDRMFMLIDYFPCCYVINFEIYRNFLVNLFSCMTKKVRANIKTS